MKPKHRLRPAPIFLQRPTMFGLDQLRLEVLGDEIIVILPATSYGVTYYKPTDSPHLLVKN